MKYRAMGRAELFEGRFDERAIQRILTTAGLSRVQVVPAGILPPILPVAFRFRGVVKLHARLLRQWSGFFMSLDGSRAASALGCYYSAGGIKA